MVTTTPNNRLNVQRILAEGEYDNTSKPALKVRGYETPGAKERQPIKAPPVVQQPAQKAQKATTQKAALPASYTKEPAATPTASAPVAPPLAPPTPQADRITWPQRANPADFDPTMSLADATTYVFAKTDAAGVPRDVAAARLQFDLAVAREANAKVNADGSVTVTSDADIAASMGNWANAIIGSYQEQMSPAPRQNFDGTATVIKDTYINPEDRVDMPRSAPWPGPFDPKQSLEGAIQHVFQFYDSTLLQLPNGTGHIPRSYTAQWIDNFIKQQKSAGVPEAGIVANLGAAMQMVSSSYNFDAYKEYYKAHPEAELEHNRMMAQNSAQTQVLAAQL